MIPGHLILRCLDGTPTRWSRRKKRRDEEGMVRFVGREVCCFRLLVLIVGSVMLLMECFDDKRSVVRDGEDGVSVMVHVSL